jgi:uncharacterized heparinase superfamily protein
VFTSSDVEPEIEEGLFLADPSGPRQAKQIVLTFAVATVPEIGWRFLRTRAAS